MATTNKGKGNLDPTVVLINDSPSTEEGQSS